MAKRKGPTPKRPAQKRLGPPGHRAGGRWLLALAGLGGLVFLATIALLTRGGGEPAAVPREKDGPVHVHGLGVNPRDGALFVATHTGLWRVAAGEPVPNRVTDLRQDTMGFTIVGPDRFLGSGHPDVREDLPPLLGLIESRDAGKTWRPISLLGEADFHVLRSKGTRVYGFDSSNGRLMFSRDQGRTWSERKPPGALVDLAVHPTNDTHLLASAEGGLFESRDEGRTWRMLGGQLGLLAWEGSNLYLVDGAGIVSVSVSEGRRWTAVGNVAGQPAALLASSGKLYVALHDGSIKWSSDGGRTWTIRSSPA